MGATFGENAFPLVHPQIAKVAAEDVFEFIFYGNYIRYIAGDERTGAEIAAVLGNAINKPDLQWMIFSDQQFLECARFKPGCRIEVAKNYLCGNGWCNPQR